MASLGGSSPGPRIAAALLGAVVLAVLVLLFVILYLAIPDRSDALLDMGVLALLLGLVSYFAQSLSREPTVQRAVAWGLGAMGFAMLFLTIWVVPPSGISSMAQLVATLFLAIILAITLSLGYWRIQSVARTHAREERRADWDRSTPPSAFDYATAKAPGTGTVGGSAPPPTQRSP